MKEVKQIWIATTKKMPLIRMVLTEKTKTDVEGTCLYVNGIFIHLTQIENWVPKGKIIKENQDYRFRKVLNGLIVNMPLEVITKHSDVIWRFAKYTFRAKGYADHINKKVNIQFWYI